MDEQDDRKRLSILANQWDRRRREREREREREIKIMSSNYYNQFPVDLKSGKINV